MVCSWPFNVWGDVIDRSDPASSPDFEFDALRHAVNYRRAIVREFGPWLHGSVLEVGAGVGLMTQFLLDVPTVERLVAVEPEPAYGGALRALLPEAHVVVGTIDDVPQNEAWNTIVNINVLEHIRDDIGELAAYRERLTPEGGTLCLFVPARKEIFAPIDRDFGHIRRYEQSELGEKLEGVGFSIERLEYFNVLGYLLWWMSFCVLRRRSFDKRGLQLFDRFVFPLLRGIERRTGPPPIGQSLIAVARVTS
jgi:SAM-dependent methyltransferase